MRSFSTSGVLPIAVLAAWMFLLSGCGEEPAETQQETPTVEEKRPEQSPEQPDAMRQEQPPSPDEDVLMQEPQPPSGEGLSGQGAREGPPPPEITQKEAAPTPEGAVEPVPQEAKEARPQPDTTELDEEDTETPAALAEDEQLHHVFFDSNSAELSGAARVTVEMVIELMQEHPNVTATFKGFTDQSGSAAYNRELAKRRIAAVSEELVDAGIDESRIREEVHGEADPATAPANEDPAQWGRRVEIALSE